MVKQVHANEKRRDGRKRFQALVMAAAVIVSAVAMPAVAVADELDLDPAPIEVEATVVDEEAVVEAVEEEELPQTLAGEREDAADAKFTADAKGFYAWLSSDGSKAGDSAIALFDRQDKVPATGEVIQDFTDMGAADDATGLENMKKALDTLKLGYDRAKNDPIVKKNGYEPWKVTNVLMATAQLNVNWEAQNYQHPKALNVGENVHCTIKDPYIGWYDDQKISYETNDGGQTGHYESLVCGYKATGFACTQTEESPYNKYNFYTWSQTFTNYPNRNAVYGNEKLYSFDEYIGLFMEFYNAKKSAGGSDTAGTDEHSSVWRRLAGGTALGTMDKIASERARLGLGEKSKTVILATSKTYKDALSAAALAGKLDATILLTSPKALSAQTARTIEDLGIKEVVIVGGPLAVSPEVADQLAGMASVEKVSRVEATNAIETANTIARDFAGKQETVIIATSAGYADALSIAPWAYANQAPIVLTKKNGDLAASTLELVKGGFKRALIVGGTGVVSETTEAQLIEAGLAVERLAGKNAVETSARIAAWELEHGFSLANAGVATRGSFKDALTASALMGSVKSPLLLVNGSDRSALDAILSGHGTEIEGGYIFGGVMAVSESNELYLSKIQ